jgi:hypothetical protein
VPVVFYISGVAYQVGKVCVVSRHRSVESVWGPFLGVSGVALLLQLLVIRYCVCRVLDPFRTMHPIVNACCTSQTQPPGSSPPPTPASETRARQVSSKIWHVLQPQWRAVSLLLVIIFYTVFLAQTSLRALSPDDYTTEKVMPWASCLVSAGGNPAACTHLADGLGPSEPMIRAAWILLSVCDPPAPPFILPRYSLTMADDRPRRLPLCRAMVHVPGVDELGKAAANCL